MAVPVVAAGARAIAGRVAKNGVRNASKVTKPLGGAVRRRQNLKVSANRVRQTNLIKASNQVASKKRLLKTVGGQINQTRAGRTANAIVVSWSIVVFTIWIYLFQLMCATLAIVGLSAITKTEDSWWAAAADFITFGSLSGVGLTMFFFGIVGTFICGLITFLVAISFYSMRGVKAFKGVSIIVLGLGFSAYLTPILNFVPWIWLWCLYVVKSNQTKSP